MLGYLPDELANAPDMPAELAHVWRWFAELHAVRSQGQFGPDPISYSEIAAWSVLTRTHVKPFEMIALRAVDEAFLTAHQKKEPIHGS